MKVGNVVRISDKMIGGTTSCELEGWEVIISTMLENELTEGITVIIITILLLHNRPKV